MKHTNVIIKDVTPEWAKETLEAHSKSQESGQFIQRPISQKTVLKYAGDMLAGNWAFTGQGISFDEDGNLMDGQHRLAAVCKSGVTIKMVVVSNLPKEVNNRIKTIDMFDQGKVRNLAGQLSIEGFKYYGEVATTSRLLVLLCGATALRNPVSTAQGLVIAGMYKNHIYNLIDAMKIVGSIGKGKLRGHFLAPLTLLRCVMQDEADLFASEFAQMTNLKQGSPVLSFIKFMDRPVTRIGGTDYQFRVMTALSTALHAYVDERETDLIRGSELDVKWLLDLAKTQVRRIQAATAGIQTVGALQQLE